MPNQGTRVKLLKLAGFLPDRWMLGLQYWIKTGRRLNLRQPKRFTEKVQVCKLSLRDPRMTVCADKYRVREYVTAKNLSHLLVPLYGVYDSTEEIDFAVLPRRFVLKATHGSGMNLFCTDKSRFDVTDACGKLDVWLKQNHWVLGREWAYKEIRPRVIAEKLISSGNSGLTDYKVFCFHGKAVCIAVDTDRYRGHKRTFYDTQWKPLCVASDQPYGRSLPKPVELSEMLDAAQTLADDFPFVRVDLYLSEHKVWFGELTFYPWSGYVNFTPDAFDFFLGSCLSDNFVK